MALWTIGRKSPTALNDVVLAGRRDNMLDIVIVGAGGCGREIYEMALESYSPNEYRIKGFLSDIPTDLDNFPEIYNEAGIIGTIVGYDIQDNDRFILAIGDVAGRLKVLETLQKRGARFISMIHPSARIFRHTLIGEGVIIYPSVVVSTYVTIKDFCFISTATSVGHDAVLEENTVLCPFTAIGGWVHMGKNCFAGPHVTVNPRVIIGANSSISANSYVARNAPEKSFIVGAPAKNM